MRAIGWPARPVIWADQITRRDERTSGGRGDGNSELRTGEWALGTVDCGVTTIPHAEVPRSLNNSRTHL
jgi:hypothetical protein